MCMVIIILRRSFDCVLHNHHQTIRPATRRRTISVLSYKLYGLDRVRFVIMWNQPGSSTCTRYTPAWAPASWWSWPSSSGWAWTGLRSPAAYGHTCGAEQRHVSASQGVTIHESRRVTSVTRWSVTTPYLRLPWAFLDSADFLCWVTCKHRVTSHNIRWWLRNFTLKSLCDLQSGWGQ